MTYVMMSLITGGLNLDEDEDITGAKRRRIASTETVATTNKPIVNRGGAQSNTTPMKITLSKPALSSAQKVSQLSLTYCLDLKYMYKVELAN